MTITYLYATAERRNSIIIEDNESISNPLAIRPQAGFTAYTRFFGTSPNQPKFVIKQPKYNQSAGAEHARAVATYTTSYKKEHLVWNSVYPHQQAELFIEGGLRLVLPFFPGKTLRNSYTRDPWTLCQQALAIARAFQEFHQLGWAYGDLLIDNVLLDQNSDGTFKAYLIDFDRVFEISKYDSNCIIAQGLLSTAWRSYFTQTISSYQSPHGISYLSAQSCCSIDTFITDVTCEINRLEVESRVEGKPTLSL